jgi:uncharacterized membrane protein YfcA
MANYGVSAPTLFFQLFGCLFALSGLYMARRPEGWARHFLAQSQRDRLTPQTYRFMSSTLGWLFFALGLLFVLVPFFEK